MCTYMDEQDEIKKIDSLILKYLEQEISNEEKVELYRWVDHSESNKLHFKEMQELWLSTEAILAPEEETQKALQQFRSKIKDYKRSYFTRRKYFYYASQIAAIAIVIFGIYYLFIKESRPEHFSCIEMAVGNKGCITLPDSSIVWLNSGSKLTYPESFSSKERKVFLNGQAYFNISRQEKHPFIVETEDMDIEVLGTRFVVKNYPQDDLIETALVEGSIKVYFPKASIRPMTLNPTEQVVYSRATKKAEVYKQDDSSIYHIWAQNKLLLRNCELTDVLKKLGAWYNEKIVYDNFSQDSVYVTLTVRNEPLTEILQTLKTISPINFYFTNDTVYITRE